MKLPVVAMLATEEPEIDPKSPDATVAILAAPPGDAPPARAERSKKVCPAPVCRSSAPNRMKAASVVDAIETSIPQRPRSDRNITSVM